MKDWQIPSAWLRISTVDAHTAGEPFRVVTAGFPEPKGATILDRRRDLERNHDQLRRALMWEPRGHADMYGCVLTPPVSDEADLGILFMHNEGYSTMCGHGVIGIAKVALETGILPREEPETQLALDTPAGLVRVSAQVDDGRVGKVRFTNVPSFVLTTDERVHVPGLGEIVYDVAFGGAFYAYVDAGQAAVGLDPDHFRELIEKGSAIKQAVSAARPITHPTEEDLSFLYGTIFIGAAEDSSRHSRNVCVFADGEVDRCPTGTGVCGRLALHHARGEVDIGEWIEIESIIGTVFRGRILDTTTFGAHAAVVPEIEGEAHITGRHDFLIDPTDPLKDGFLLR